MKIVIFFTTNNADFAIEVESFEKIKVLSGTLKIKKIQYNSDKDIVEYWVEVK